MAPLAPLFPQPMCYNIVSQATPSARLVYIPEIDCHGAGIHVRVPDPTDMSVRLIRRCNSISYRVAGDGVYYFVFYLSGQRSTSLDIYFDFSRTLYEVSSDMVVKNCPSMAALSVPWMHQ